MGALFLAVRALALAVFVAGRAAASCAAGALLLCRAPPPRPPLTTTPGDGTCHNPLLDRRSDKEITWSCVDVLLRVYLAARC